MKDIEKTVCELQEFLELNNISSNVDLLYNNTKHSIFENNIEKNIDVRGVLNNIKYTVALTTQNKVLQSILSSPYTANKRDEDLETFNQLKQIIINNGFQFIEGSYWWFGCI